MSTAPRRRKQKAQRQGGDPGVSLERFMQNVDNQARVLRRVLTTNSTLGTGVAGFLGVLNLASSANVTSAVNWAQYQDVALEWRVVGLEAMVYPLVNSQTAPTTPAPSMIAVSAYSSDTLPTTYGSVSQGPGAKILTGYRPFKFAASSKDFPNAKLWTGIATAMPAANVFGIVMADPGTNPVSTASTVYFRATIRYLVELRSLN